MFGFKKPEKSADKKDDKSLVDNAQNGSNVKGSPSQTYQLRQMANQDKAYVSNNAYANFTKELKSLSEKHKHLGDYLVDFTADENNDLPEFRGRFGRGDKFPGQRNLIYPVGNGVFVHVLYDPGDTRDEYIPIEPSESQGLNINISKFTVKKFTCAPIIAKNKGAKINPILLANFSTFCITAVAERAIPTANAPTIGDNPSDPAIAAAPKNDAVAIPSILPVDFHNLVVITFGITKMATINIIAKNANILRIVNVTSIKSTVSNASAPPNDATTDNTAIAKISSTTAAAIIKRASGDLILLNSFST